ncbi:MAG: magnesium transporter [Bdellovibrionaceae bacterium]|nr:magnesium transporter [Pseudobdellovibrionaceae bacterium]
MIDERAKMLIATIKKLYHRDAKHNIQRIFAKTHEADISTILEGFEPGERFDLFRMEPSIEKQSETLSHLKPEIQKEILSCLTNQEILRLVDLMDSDDAADMLGQLPEAEANAILSKMKKEDSDGVADLMGYPEDSAGGIMSSDYLALNQNLTVSDTIKNIQEEDEDIGVAFYIYVVNDNEQLVGVLSLKTLLLSKKNETLKDLMFTDVISVTVDTDQEKVAKVVEHYDFLSVPVVDQNNRLVGIITVDDIIDVIREEAEDNLLAMGRAGLGVDATTFERLKARLSWLLLALFGGILCFAVVFFFGLMGQQEDENTVLWVLAAYIPLLLSIGATIGSQASTVTVGAIRSGILEINMVKQHLFKELKLAFLFMILFGLLVFGLAELLLGPFNVSWLLAFSISLQVLISMFLGNLIPIAISRLGIDASVASIPVYATFADVSAMLVLFGLYHMFY